MTSLPYEAGSLLLEGPAGVGKTTAIADYVQSLMAQGIDAQNILVLVPNHRSSLFDLLNHLSGKPHIYTYAALVHMLVQQFWPLIAHQPGTDVPPEPRFINLEASYYYISQFLNETEGEALLATLHLPRIRIVQQIWNLIFQAANAGLTLKQAQERLEYSLSKQSYYPAAFAIAQRYQEFCHQHGLVDRAKQVELFTASLLDADAFQSYFRQVISCVIADNIEEMPSTAHDFLFWCMENTESSLLVMDWDAGFRTVLGADAANAAQLGMLCSRRLVWQESETRSPVLSHLEFQLQTILIAPEQSPIVTIDLANAFHLNVNSVYQGMIDAAVEQVRTLLYEENTPPSQIVMVVPYLGDMLRLSLESRLDKLDIPHYTYRPSRPLESEPLVQAVLILIRLRSGETISSTDLAKMFSTLIPDMDMIRATLLSKAACIKGEWISFANLPEMIRIRISAPLGQNYEMLREWVATQAEPNQLRKPLYEFIAALVENFGANYTNVDVLETLKNSLESFEPALEEQQDWRSAARKCVELIQAGFIAPHAVFDARAAANAILILPAHSFLSLDKTVDYQVWMDVSSSGWFERMNQVLTNPYILRRSFPPEMVWSEAMEEASERELLKSLSLGLIRHCRKGVYAFASTTGLTGAEQRSPLLTTLQQIIAPADG
jgi:hypothetical protein